MDKENKLLDKLDKVASDEFNKFISFFNKNDNDKKLFIKFLFSDIIPPDKIGSFDIEDIIREPSYIIEDYLYQILESGNENTSNFYNEILDKLKKKKTDIKKKIIECIKDTDVLKKIYLNISVESYLPTEKALTLSFKNKSVLTYLNQSSSLKLGEIFARYMFTSIDGHDDSMSNPTVFYDKENIDSYYDSAKNEFREFNDPEMKNNFRYWIFLIKIISEMFSSNSDYDMFYNEKKFESEINTLTKIESKKEPKKDKTKKQKGGANNNSNRLESLIKKEFKKNSKNSKNKKNKESQISVLKKKYIEIFTKCIIETESNNNKIYLKTKYITQFEKYMLEWIKNKYFEGNNTKEIPSYTKIENPFLKKSSDIPLKDLIGDNSKKDKYTYSDMIGKNFKYDIFQFLEYFKNNDIDTFLNQIKKNLIYVLYYLYKIKKNIYTKYIEILDDKSINNAPEKTNSSTSPLTHNSTHNYKSSNNNYNKNKHNKKPKLGIDSYINSLKKKIINLEKQSGLPEYDKLHLFYEEEIKKAVIEKYKLLSNVQKNNTIITPKKNHIPSTIRQRRSSS